MKFAMPYGAVSSCMIAVLSCTTPAICLESPQPQTSAKPSPSATPPKPEPANPSDAKPQAAKADAKPQAAKAIPADILQFCANNLSAASDARIAWQAAKLTELETQVKKRIADLEAKRAEYVEWLKRRDEAMRKVEDDVVAIYAHMRPEAAAQQLAAMDDTVAAALLAKFNARVASAILNEMEPGRAARLTNAMIGPPPDADKHLPQDRKKS
jgi:flagellar motility protein MotE (MotC chaperone)